MQRQQRVTVLSVAILLAITILIGSVWVLQPSSNSATADSQTSAATAVSDNTAPPKTVADNNSNTAVVLADVNLTQSSRYAFITDKAAPQLAVLDTYERQLLAPIALKTIADSIGISRYGGYLAYAKRGDKQLYLFDLKKRQHRAFSVANPINALAVHFGGHWIAYTGATGSGIIDTRNGAETLVNTTGDVSLLYPPGADRLLVVETAQGRLQSVNLTTMQTQTLLAREKPMSAISVMPNGMALFFVADGVLQRYSLLDNSLKKLDISASAWRPYVTSDSRLVLLFSDEQSSDTAELLAVNAYTYAVKHRFALPNWQAATQRGMDEAIATGWLEQVAVVTDNNDLYSLTLNDNPNTQNHTKDPTTASGAIRDMLVQSDSKTLLATRDNSEKLWIFNLREQRFDPPLALGLQQPDTIVMGETNTLCH